MLNPPPGPVGPVATLGDTFGWALKDPAWLSKILLTGLILLIPIVGQMSALGWMLATRDNLRQGRAEMAPAGFYIGRGVPVFVVYLVYVLVLVVVIGTVDGIGVGLESTGTAGGSSLGGLLLAVGGLLELIGSVAIGLAFPALVVSTERGGISGGLAYRQVWALIRTHQNASLSAGAVAIVANLVAGLGIVACCVGILFTAGFAYAILAGIVVWYERQLDAPQTVV